MYFPSTDMSGQKRKFGPPPLDAVVPHENLWKLLPPMHLSSEALHKPVIFSLGLLLTGQPTRELGGLRTWATIVRSSRALRNHSLYFGQSCSHRVYMCSLQLPGDEASQPSCISVQSATFGGGERTRFHF